MCERRGCSSHEPLVTSHWPLYPYAPMTHRHRAAVLCFLLTPVMAFSLNTRALTDTPPRPQDVARIAELRQVHEAFKWFQSHEADLRKLQLQVTKIPAPPFGESRRAEWVRDRFKEFGLYDIEIDKAGNVIGLSRGSKQKSPLGSVTLPNRARNKSS